MCVFVRGCFWLFFGDKIGDTFGDTFGDTKLFERGLRVLAVIVRGKNEDVLKKFFGRRGCEVSRDGATGSRLGL